MEHVHTAPIAGMVAAIDVAEGEQVTTGRIVVEIEGEVPVDVVPASRRDPYAVTSIVEKNRVTGSAQNNRRLWLWAPAQGRGDNRLIRFRG